MNKLSETSIPQNYSTGLYNDKSYDLSAELTATVADIIFTSTSECLGNYKTKEHPVAFIYKRNNDDFIAGAVIKYMPNEDDKSKPGSWSYVWTWNKEDIPNNATLIDISSLDCYEYFRGTARSKYSIAFKDQAAIYEITRYFLEVVKKWLDDNASDTEEIGVQLEGVFVATAAVENGVVYKSLVPEGEIKKLIKDDAAIEV